MYYRKSNQDKDGPNFVTEHGEWDTRVYNNNFLLDLLWWSNNKTFRPSESCELLTSYKNIDHKYVVKGCLLPG